MIKRYILVFLFLFPYLFQGVKNSEVIGKLEQGQRLSLPQNSPPKLYSILTQCKFFYPVENLYIKVSKKIAALINFYDYHLLGWAYEPSKRPTFQTLKIDLCDILHTEQVKSSSNSSSKSPFTFSEQHLNTMFISNFDLL